MWRLALLVPVVAGALPLPPPSEIVILFYFLLEIEMIDVVRAMLGAGAL